MFSPSVYLLGIDVILFFLTLDLRLYRDAAVGIAILTAAATTVISWICLGHHITVLYDVFVMIGTKPLE